MLPFILYEAIFGAVFTWVQEVDENMAGIEFEERLALFRGLSLAALFVWYRRALRSKFDSPTKIFSVDFMLLKDFACWMLCTPCAIAQEGLEVDQAQGVQVECCFRLRDVKTGQLVGPPVGEAAPDG